MRYIISFEIEAPDEETAKEWALDSAADNIMGAEIEEIIE